MTDQLNRDSILAKCRKLAAMTIERGATEQEAKIAASKLAKLIEDFNVSQDEMKIRLDAQHCIIDEFIELNSSASDWVELIVPISKLFHCRCWYEETHEDVLELGYKIPVTKYRYFGFEVDVVAAVSMTAIVHSAIHTESTNYKIPRQKGGARKRDSFRLGVIHGLAERLRTLIPPVVLSDGKSLMILKDQLVTDEYAKLNLRLRRGHHGNTPADPNAYAAGRRASANIHLDRSSKIERTSNRIEHSK